MEIGIKRGSYGHGLAIGSWRTVRVHRGDEAPHWSNVIARSVEGNWNWLIDVSPFQMDTYTAFILALLDMDWHPFTTAATSIISEVPESTPVCIVRTDAGDVPIGEILGRPIEVLNPYEPEFEGKLNSWLLGIFPGEQVQQNAERGMIEALHREVQLGIIENDALKAQIAELTKALDQVTNDLTEAQIEVRTFKALHAQLERQNEALLLELSKGRIQPETTAPAVQVIKAGVGALMTLALTFTGTYAGTKAAMPDDEAASLSEASTRIVNQCDQVIMVLDAKRSIGG